MPVAYSPRVKAARIAALIAPPAGADAFEQALQRRLVEILPESPLVPVSVRIEHDPVTMSRRVRTTFMSPFGIKEMQMTLADEVFFGTAPGVVVTVIADEVKRCILDDLTSDLEKRYAAHAQPSDLEIYRARCNARFKADAVLAEPRAMRARP